MVAPIIKPTILACGSSLVIPAYGQWWLPSLAVLNEFAMMYSIRDSFPLHYTIFKQYASHLPHEANVEQLFSRSGNLSDPNIDPDFLATLTSISANKKVYKPTVSEIKDMYAVPRQGRRGERRL
jgi:hypothetical protein